MVSWDIEGVNTHTSGPNTVAEAPGQGDAGVSDATNGAADGAADTLVLRGSTVNPAAATTTARSRVTRGLLRAAALALRIMRSFASWG
jgi:hypothetical protein